MGTFMMPTMLDGSLLAAALVLCVPVLVLCAECVAALGSASAGRHEDGRREDAAQLSSPRSSGESASAGATECTARPAVTVLVPAHDEVGQIGTLLESLRPQLTAADRLIVIADNCTDDTAAVARDCGAEVIERREPTLR